MGTTAKEFVKESTPLPLKQFIVLCIFLVIDNLASSSIFPYISQLTCDLLNLDEERDAKLVGYYAGAITACYYLTQFISAPIWGKLSDKFGRRPILLIGISGNVIAILMFGMSKWYIWALIARLIHGLLNGNLGVCKTYLKEITDETNQSRAFSFLGVTFSIGVICKLIQSLMFLVGPIIGGFLSRPSEKFPLLFNNFIFNTFPYLLPNLIIALLSLVGLILGYFFLFESNKEVLKKSEKINEEKSENNQDIFEENIIDLNASPVINQESFEKVVNESRWQNLKSYLLVSNSVIFTTRGPLLSCLLYAHLGAIEIAFNDVFPIWLWSPVANQGLGMEPYEIGLLAALTGTFIFVSQITLTPWLNTRFGMKTAYNLTTILSIIPLFLLPDIYHFASKDTIWIMWALLIYIYLWRMVWVEASFTSTMLLINTSVPPSELGVLNGIAQSLVALGRAIFPFCFTPLFALSISGKYSFPFDVHMVFYLCGILSLILVPMCLLIPDPKEGYNK